jgi:sugar lactone lactonase YvrE
VAGALGELFLVEPASGKVTSIAQTNGHLRGLSYSLDYKTLYISDSGNKALLTAKVRPDGTVDAPVTFARGLGTFADGVATDICGNVFVSDKNGGPLLRVTPAAKVEMVSPLNGDHVAGLAFGSGKQGWDDHSLYGVSEQDSAIYEIKLGVRGAPPPPNEL